MGKFTIRKTATGYVFHLKAANGETIATSEVYARRSSLREGAKSVALNAPIAKVEDQTVEGFAKCLNPKFEIYLDAAGAFRFRLRARNGQIIASSEAYQSKQSCEGGVESVRQNAPDAEIVEEEA